MIINNKILMKILISFCILVNGCSVDKTNEMSQNSANILSISNEVNSRSNINKQTETKQEIVAPLLELSMASETKLDQPLKLHWKITNPNSKPIFVYSSLLDSSQSAFADTKFDSKQKHLEILFTRLTKVILEPNYFPKTEFKKIEAGKYLEADTNSKFSILQLMLIETEQISIKTRRKILTGEWNIKALIGYGEEIESVQKTISETKGGHPIDPVVDWQKIATSKPIKVIFK